MKILIKGAGDLATGIASRLYGAGHQILMTELAQIVMRIKGLQVLRKETGLMQAEVSAP